MIKGVNKTVIEIKCTDNGYFEKAILFVNPAQGHLSQKRLQSEAEKYVDMIKIGIKTDTVKSPSLIRRQRRKRVARALFLISGALSAAAGIFFLFLNKL